MQQHFSPTRSAAFRAAVCSGASLVCSAVMALDAAEHQRTPPVAGTKGQLEVQTVAPTVEASLRPGLHDASARTAGAESLRARYWVDRRGVGVGAGADWSAVSTTAPLRPVVGVRADVAQGARLVYEVGAGAAPWIANPQASTAAAQQQTLAETRVALEFKAADSSAKQFKDGLLRMQLSGGSTLNFRPRGGGMVVSYRAKF